MATRRASAETPDTVFLTAEQMEQERQSRQLAMSGDENEQSPEDRVKTMLADLRADQNAKIRLYRRSGNSLSICQDYSLDDFESANFADVVRMKWGAGKYDVKLYGSKGVVTAVTLSIQEPLTNPIPQNSGGNDALAQVLAQMAQQQQMILEVLTRQPAPAPAVDPMQQMTQMLTMMKLMKEATASPAPQTSPIGEIVAAMRELRGAAKELMPGEAEEKEPSMMQLAGEMMPVLKSLVQQQQAPSQLPMPAISLPPAIASAPMPNPIQQPATNGTIQAQPEPQTPSDQEMKQQIFIKLISDLEILAKQNAPHEQGADLILDEKIPDDILEFIESEGWFDALKTYVPSLVVHETWLRAVREIVISSLYDNEEETQQETQQVTESTPAAANPTP